MTTEHTEKLNVARKAPPLLTRIVVSGLYVWAIAQLAVSFSHLLGFHTVHSASDNHGLLYGISAVLILILASVIQLNEAVLALLDAKRADVRAQTVQAHLLALEVKRLNSTSETKGQT